MSYNLYMYNCSIFVLFVYSDRLVDIFKLCMLFPFTDHETELKIAKSRVRELELTLYTQREEVLYINNICYNTWSMSYQ